MNRYFLKNWLILFTLILFLSACVNTGKNQIQGTSTPSGTNNPTDTATNSPEPDYPPPSETEILPTIAYPVPENSEPTVNIPTISTDVIDANNINKITLLKDLKTEAPVRLSWSLDQSSIALIGYDFFTVYSFPELEILFEYTYQSDEFLVDISPDGQTYATSFKDGTLIINNWRTKETRTINTGLQFMSGEFSPDGSQIMIVHMDEWAASIYDVVSGELLTKISGFETAAPVYNVQFSEDGKQAIWIARATIQLSDISNNTMRPAIFHQDFISSFATSPNGKLLVTAAGNTKNDAFVPFIFFYDTNTSDVLNSMEMQKSVYSMSFSPDSSLLAVDRSGSVLIIDLTTFEEVYTFEAHPESINQIAFSPDGNILATTGSDQKVKFWSIP